MQVLFVVCFDFRICNDIGFGWTNIVVLLFELGAPGVETAVEMSLALFCCTQSRLIVLGGGRNILFFALESEILFVNRSDVGICADVILSWWAIQFVDEHVTPVVEEFVELGFAFRCWIFTFSAISLLRREKILP